MKINLLNLFEIRSQNEAVIWDDLVNMDLVISPIFKLFYETYNILDLSSIKYFQYYSTEYNEMINFGVIVSDIHKGQCLVDSIFDTKLINQTYAKLSKAEDDILRLNVEGCFPFAISHSNDYFLVGHEERNKDKIYLQLANKRIYLTNNIFTFFSNMQLIPEPNKWLPDLKKLYKNWDEDFWRVRE